MFPDVTALTLEQRLMLSKRGLLTSLLGGVGVVEDGEVSLLLRLSKRDLLVYLINNSPNKEV